MPVEVLNIKELKNKSGNVYESIFAISKRSRRLQEENRVELEEKLAPFRAKVYETMTEYDIDRVYPEQVIASIKNELLPKPTVKAIHQYMDGEFTIAYR